MLISTVEFHFWVRDASVYYSRCFPDQNFKTIYVDIIRELTILTTLSNFLKWRIFNLELLCNYCVIFTPFFLSNLSSLCSQNRYFVSEQAHHLKYSFFIHECLKTHTCVYIYTLIPHKLDFSISRPNFIFLYMYVYYVCAYT